MKKLAIILITPMMVACSTENKQEEVVHELAKKDLIEKLQFPENTKFNNENIEVKKASTGEAFIAITYLIKTTIKSQDRHENKVVKTYSMNYKKIGEGGLAPKDYELISFK